MLTHVLFHPVTTFIAGVLLALFGVMLLFTSCAPQNHSAREVSEYQGELSRMGPTALASGSSEEKVALDRFTTFLKNIGNAEYVRQNTRLVYEEDALLDDTLVKKRGAAAIEAYFLKTSETMTFYEVTINDVTRSGADHYVRWTMVFAAPALSGGERVHSTGVTQLRFNPQGKVMLHQDFWDSGKHFFGRLPVAGAAIEFIRKRLH